jgi:hypothetical protein
MTTSSRRLSQKGRTSKPSHTSGKSKGGQCVKSALRTFGMNANPYKLKGAAANRYIKYCREVDSYKGNEKSQTTKLYEEMQR